MQARLLVFSEALAVAQEQAPVAQELRCHEPQRQASTGAWLRGLVNIALCTVICSLLAECLEGNM